MSICLDIVLLVALTSAAFSGAACGNDSTSSRAEIQLAAVDSLVQLPDSSFLSSFVPSMKSDGMTTYIADAGSARLVAISDDWKRSVAIARPGEAPGEFRTPTAVFLDSALVYAYDGATRRLSVFDRAGEYLNQFVLPERMTGDFVIRDGQLIGSFPFLTHSPILLKPGGGEQTELRSEVLGTTWSEFQNKARARRHIVLVSDSTLVTVGVSIPVIEVYDAMNQRVRLRDLSSHPLLADRLAEADRMLDEERQENKTSTVVQYAAPLGGFLALLIVTGATGDSDLRATRLLLVDVGTLDVVSVVDLRGVRGNPLRWFFSFTATSDGFVAYEAVKGVLYRYRL